MGNSYVEHNGSGYVDTTVDSVIKKEKERKKRAKESYKYHMMCKSIKDILDEEGYVLEGPISLIKVDSGRKRRIY